MILYLTIAIIIWLALTCVYFINDARKARDQIKDGAQIADFWWGLYEDTRRELWKYKRPRDPKTGRWV